MSHRRLTVSRIKFTTIRKKERGSSELVIRQWSLEIPPIPSFTSVSFAFYLHYLSRSRGRDIRRPVRENSDCLRAKLQESQEWRVVSRLKIGKRRGVIISSSSTMACEFFKVSRKTSTTNDEKKKKYKEKKKYISKHLPLFIVRARNRLPIYRQ